MDRLFDMIERSVLVQSLVTLTLVTATVFMYVTERVVPEGMQTLTYSVVAFWMGSKVQHAIDNNRVSKGR